MKRPIWNNENEDSLRVTMFLKRTNTVEIKHLEPIILMQCFPLFDRVCHGLLGCVGNRGRTLMGAERGGETHERPREPRDEGLRRVADTVWRHKCIRNASAAVPSPASRRPGLQSGLRLNSLSAGREPGRLGLFSDNTLRGGCGRAPGGRLPSTGRPLLTGVRGLPTPGCAFGTRPPPPTPATGGRRGGRPTT